MQTPDNNLLRYCVDNHGKHASILCGPCENAKRNPVQNAERKTNILFNLRIVCLQYCREPGIRHSDWWLGCHASEIRPSIQDAGTPGDPLQHLAFNAETPPLERHLPLHGHQFALASICTRPQLDYSSTRQKATSLVNL